MAQGENRPSIGIGALLLASALVFLGFRFAQGISREDTEPYESPLMMSVARQLVAGPGELYGPYRGTNPLVLIHAPLYYRVAGLLAWPIWKAGLHPVEAARVAGRLVSSAGLLAILAAAYRLGRIGSRSRGAGMWAAMLVASCPVLDAYPFAVRPDLLGVALQTWGVALTLESIECGRRREVLASILFGLSFCVKQHLVVTWGVMIAITAVVAKPRPSSIARLIGPGVGTAGLVYAVEAIVTGGRIWDSALIAASGVGRVHPGDGLHVTTVLAAVAGKAAGLSAVAVAAAFGRAGAGLVAALAMLSIAQVFWAGPWITTILPALSMAGLVIGLVGCARAGRVERMLGACVTAELVVVIVLSWSSSGAWINYAIPMVPLTSAMIARPMMAAAESAGWPGRTILATAALAVLASAWMDAKVEATRRAVEHRDLARVLKTAGVPPSAMIFGDRPGRNRMMGRLDLVFDEWLYPVFESRKLAEPRSRWLGPRIWPAAGVGAVVLESEGDRIEGLPGSLPERGYRRVGRSGRFWVWVAFPGMP